MPEERAGSVAGVYGVPSHRFRWAFAVFQGEAQGLLPSLGGR